MKTLIKSNITKTLILSLLFTFLAVSLKAQQVINFTGTWKRNADKCDAGNLSVNSIPVSITVEQNKSDLQIKRVSKNAQGDSTSYSEKIKFDGSSSTSVVKPNLNKSASVNWSADYKQLTETSNYIDGQGNPVQKGKENWTLSDDGKTLTIQTILIANGQDYQLTEVFDKQ